MKIKMYRYPGEWELNFVGKVWNLRLGNIQCALWRNYRPVFSFVRPRLVQS